jgi:hypothetical protein
MGFNKYFVPEPPALLKMLRRDGVRHFFNRKIDALLGNAESMKILDDAYALVKLDMSDSEIISILETNYATVPEQPAD